MTIQWFPGHMAKAKRQVQEQLKLVDIIFELVDARLPLSSRNPMIDDVIQQKPRLIILNKKDLADDFQTAAWIRKFDEMGIPAVAINSFKGTGLKDVIRLAEEVLKEQRERLKARGVRERAIRAMIVGIPNVGKSTLINRLANKNIAKTGNMPGVTRAQQWIKVEKRLELLDTPGILWPKFEDATVGYKLAVTGAIKDQVLPLDDVAIYGLRFLAEYYPERLFKQYGIHEVGEQVVDAFDQIGRQKNAYEQDGDIDYDKVSRSIIQDIRTGVFGVLTFDRV
ncbi:MAG TPA: ribosome biogenesis GTPase YlqF [Savagea sp.]